MASTVGGRTLQVVVVALVAGVALAAAAGVVVRRRRKRLACTALAELARSADEAIGAGGEAATAALMLCDRACEAVLAAARQALAEPQAAPGELPVAAIEALQQESRAWSALRHELTSHAASPTGLLVSAARLASVPEDLGAVAGALVSDTTDRAGDERALRGLLDAVLRHPAARSRSIRALAANDPGDVVEDDLFEQTRRSLRHGEERHAPERLSALRSSMGDLALLDGATDARRRYARVDAAQTQRLSETDTQLARDTRTAIQQEAGLLNDRLPASRSPSGVNAELMQIATERRDATSHYLPRVRSLVAMHQGSASAATASLRQRLDGAEAALTRCDEQLAAGDALAGLLALFEQPPPLAARWRPAIAYAAACDASTNALRELGARQAERLLERVTDVSHCFEDRAARLAQTLRGAVGRWAEARRAAENEVLCAAADCREETLAMLERSPAHGGSAKAKGEATLSALADLASARLAALGLRAIPAPGRGAARTPEAEVSDVGDLLDTLAGRCERWSDWSSCLAGDGADTMAGLLRLAGVEEALAPQLHAIARADEDRRVDAQLAESMVALTRRLDDADDAGGAPADDPGPCASTAIVDHELDRVSRCLRALADPVDPHRDERETLHVRLEPLGLLDPSTTLPSRKAYEHAQARYQAQLRDAFASMASSCRDAFAECRATATERHVDAPRVGPLGGDRLRGLIVGTHDCTQRYVNSLECLLAANSSCAPPSRPARLHARLEAAATWLARCEEQVGRGEHVAALMSLARIDLPSSVEWEPSAVLAAAMSAAAEELRSLRGLHWQLLRRWVAGQGCELDAAKRAICAKVDGAAASCDERREQLWRGLRGHADDLLAETVHALGDAVERADAALAVRGAVAVLAVDELATKRLGEASRELLPTLASASEDSAREDDQLGVFERICGELETNSAAWAATSAALAAAIGPGLGGADAWAQIFLPLAGVPAHVVSGGRDMFCYLHGALPGQLEQSAHTFVNGLIEHAPLCSAASVHDGGLLGAVELVHAGSKTLEGQWLEHLDSPGTAVLHYAADQAKPALGQLGHAFIQTPQVEAAMGQADAALRLAAPALEHGLAYVPIVTLVMATRRELRVRREHETAIAESVKSVAIDTGAVGIGILGGHGVAWLFAIPHAWPATIPGAILASFGAKHFKKHVLNKAKDHYRQAHDAYQGQLEQLTRRLAATACSRAEAERALLVQSVGSPEPLERQAESRLRELVTGFAQATRRYLDGTGAVLELVSVDQGAPTLETLQERLTDARRALVRCDEHQAADELIPALVDLAAVRLPVGVPWTLAAAYQDACAAAAQDLSELSDTRRRAVGRWVAKVSEQIDGAKLHIAETWAAATETFERERDAAVVPVAQAFEAVQLATARAHGARGSTA